MTDSSINSLVERNFKFYEFITKTTQPALIFATPLPNATFLGACTQGGCDPQIRTRPRFLYNAPTRKFHHPTFTRSEVIMLTNKQMLLKTSNVLRYGMTLDNNCYYS